MFLLVDESLPVRQGLEPHLPLCLLLVHLFPSSLLLLSAGNRQEKTFNKPNEYPHIPSPHFQLFFTCENSWEWSLGMRLFNEDKRFIQESTLCMLIQY